MEAYFFLLFLILWLENLFYENIFDYYVSLVRVKKISNKVQLYFHFYSVIFLFNL